LHARKTPGDLAIFRYLSDLALLEEAISRLGEDQTCRLMGREGDKRNWKNSYRFKNRIPPDKRRVLLEALTEFQPEQERRFASALEQIAQIFLNHPAVLRLLNRLQDENQTG
jgi:hypothetical protein